MNFYVVVCWVLVLVLGNRWTDSWLRVFWWCRVVTMMNPFSDLHSLWAFLRVDCGDVCLRVMLRTIVFAWDIVIDHDVVLMCFWVWFWVLAMLVSRCLILRAYRVFDWGIVSGVWLHMTLDPWVLVCPVWVWIDLNIHLVC